MNGIHGYISAYRRRRVSIPTLMALSFVALSGLLGVLVFKIVSSWFRNFRLKRHMFPSPPGIPFLGNALQVPHGEPWLAFEQWKEKYGKSLF